MTSKLHQYNVCKASKAFQCHLGSCAQQLSAAIDAHQHALRHARFTLARPCLHNGIHPRTRSHDALMSSQLGKAWISARLFPPCVCGPEQQT